MLRKLLMIMINQDSRFNVQDLRFFYFDVLKLYNSEHVIYNHKKIIFKEVYIFNKRVYDYVLFIDEIIIKKNLFFCFRESTLN